MPSYRAAVIGPSAFIQVLRFVALALLIPAVLFSLACGGGSSTTTTVGPAPTFTSTAPPIAQEGALYTYTPTTTTTDNSTVTYTVSGVTGAAFSNGTMTWTPTHAQSRVANAFTVTATTSTNGTATQTFSITPNGNIDGTAVDHAITGTGLVDYPQDLSAASIFALVPNKTGGFYTLTGSGDASGNFTVGNVPVGGFWLHIPRTDNGFTTDNYVWTTSSDIDAGQLIVGRPDAVLATTPVTVNTNVTLTTAPVSGDTLLWSSPDAHSFGNVPALPSKNLVTTFPQNGGLIDSSKGDRGFLLHYTTSGLSSHILESETFSSLSETNGGTVSLTGSTVANSGSTTDPNIKITQFDAINAALPNTTGPTVKNFTLYDAGYPGTEGWPIVNPSDSSLLALVSASLNNVTADTDLGSIPFGIVSQTGVGYAQFEDLSSRTISSGGSTYILQDVGSVIVANTIPSSTIVPLLGEPTAPTVNGVDFLSNQTITSLTPQISWGPPAVGTPTAYELTVLNPAAAGVPSQVHYFYTSGSGVTIPPGILQANTSYVFILKAMLYQNSAFLTAPFRMGTSISATSEVSGLMTTSAGATATIRKNASNSVSPQTVLIQPAANGRLAITVKK
jgi:hypothetical protein